MKYLTKAILTIDGTDTERELEIEYEVKEARGIRYVNVLNTTSIREGFNGRVMRESAAWLWDALSLSATNRLDALMLDQWRAERGAA